MTRNERRAFVAASLWLAIAFAAAVAAALADVWANGPTAGLCLFLFAAGIGMALLVVHTAEKDR